MLDYAYQGREKLGEPNLAILVPKRPKKQVENWLTNNRISVIWHNRNVFEDNADGRFI